MTIKLVAICGSPVPGGNVEMALKESMRTIDRDPAVRHTVITVAERTISGCRHCNWCVKNQTEDRFCRQEDDMAQIYRHLVEADAVVMATPVHVGRMSGVMANLLDRMRALLYGRKWRGAMKDKVGCAIAVAFFRNSGAEPTLWLLNRSFQIFDMIPACRGAVIYTSIDGTGRVKSGQRYHALEDSFGLSAARAAIEKTVELARWIKAGKEATSSTVLTGEHGD